MASNRIPKSVRAVLILLDDAADGAREHESSIGLKQNTAEALRGDHGLLKSALDLWKTLKSNKPRQTSRKNSIDSDVKAFLATTIDVLQYRIGKTWNSAWEEAGFGGGSIALPRRAADRLVLLGTLETYFTKHPEQQSADLKVTAARAAELAARGREARTGSSASNTAAGQAKAAYEAAFDAGRRRLSGLVNELSQLIGPEDPRWYAFGLSRPSDPETPGVPELLVLTAGVAGGLIFADWDDARRAEGYRIYRQLPGESPAAVGTTGESEFVLRDQPAGVEITITVTAYNDAGESQPSEPAKITLG